jgi:two-component system, NarL family, invasion response regulator UvrY
MIKILIADDHAIVRKGLRQILTDTPDIIVSDECCNGEELLEKVETDSYGVVLLDISMPGQNGLEVLKQLQGENPQLPVLMLSMYPEEHYAMRAMKAGAAGYVTKDSAPDELVHAIRKVYWGGTYISSSLTKNLTGDFGPLTECPRHTSLSNREFQIFCLISAGKSLKQIAEKLSLSIKTVSTYRKRILKKMLMTNNQEIIRYAIKTGLAC